MSGGTAVPGGTSFSLNNGKQMTEIEIVVTDGISERSYYLDVCATDPQGHDVVSNYYGLPAYPDTGSVTRALVDQIIIGNYTLTPDRVSFIANYLVGSQKNTQNLILPVKSLNQDWHSLHYHLSIWNNSAPVIIDNKWSSEEWLYLTDTLFKKDPFVFLYAVDKNTGKTTWVKDWIFGASLMNISNENYYRHLLENLVYQCKSTGYDSIFLDSFGMATIYSFTKANYVRFGGAAGGGVSDVPYDFTEYKHPQLGGLTWIQAS
jgi:hypothetical protein